MKAIVYGFVLEMEIYEEREKGRDTEELLGKMERSLRMNDGETKWIYENIFRDFTNGTL